MFCILRSNSEADIMHQRITTIAKRNALLNTAPNFSCWLPRYLYSVCLVYTHAVNNKENSKNKRGLLALHMRIYILWYTTLMHTHDYSPGEEKIIDATKKKGGEGATTAPGTTYQSYV